jgi:hypothetical protein
MMSSLCRPSRSPRRMWRSASDPAMRREGSAPEERRQERYAGSIPAVSIFLSLSRDFPWEAGGIVARIEGRRTRCAHRRHDLLSLRLEGRWISRPRAARLEVLGAPEREGPASEVSVSLRRERG